MFNLSKRWVVFLNIILLSIPVNLLSFAFNIDKALAAAGDNAGDVVINELMWTGSTASTADEWIELRNMTASPINLANWKITNAKGQGVDFTITAGTIPANGYFLISSRAETDANSKLNVTPDIVDASITLLNTDIQYVLKNSVNTTIDTADDGAGPPLAGDNANKYSMERNATPGNGALAGSWHTASASYNFDFGATERGTPKALNLDAPDAAGPTNGSIIVNNNAAYTNSANVTLTISATDNHLVREMIIANNAGFTGANWEFYATSKLWTLPAGDGTKTVYIQFKDASGNLSNVASDAIVLDTTAPSAVVSAPVNNSLLNSLTALFGTASDATAGLASVAATIQRLSDNKYWNGTDWVASATDLATTLNGNNWSKSTGLPTFSDGSYKVSAKATDNAGNVGAYSSNSFVFDTTAPTATGFTINGGATLTNSTSVSLNITGSDTNGVAQMMLGNDENFSNSVWEAYNSTKTWILGSEVGEKTVYLKFKDNAGNTSSAFSAKIGYKTNIAAPVTQNIGTTKQTFNPTSGVEITAVGINSTILTATTYTQNPTSSVPPTGTTLGKFYDFSVSNTSTVSWPVEIKIYYTAADLAASGNLREDQLQGLFYYDSTANQWKKYSDTGVNKNDVTVGGVNYAGYVWANADHFTPVTVGADNVAPEKPANFTSESQDGAVNLSWNAVSDADRYVVRYRQATTIDTTGYTYVSVAKNTSAKVIELSNNVEYEFGVTAIDAAGNESVYAVAVNTPKAVVAEKPTTTAKVATTFSSSSGFVGTAKAAESTTKTEKLETQKSESASSTSGGNKEGEVKGETKTAPARDWTKMIVTVAILIIALGAGMGGYYGYQWLTEQKVEKKEKPPKKLRNNGRW